MRRVQYIGWLPRFLCVQLMRTVFHNWPAVPHASRRLPHTTEAQRRVSGGEAFAILHPAVGAKFPIVASRVPGDAKLLLLEREMGFEPTTSSLGSWHSTTELLPLKVVFNSLHDTKDLTPQSRESIQFH